MILLCTHPEGFFLLLQKLLLRNQKRMNNRFGMQLSAADNNIFQTRLYSIKLINFLVHIDYQCLYKEVHLVAILFNKICL